MKLKRKAKPKETITPWGSHLVGEGTKCVVVFSRSPGGYAVYMRNYEGVFERSTIREARKYANELFRRCRDTVGLGGLKRRGRRRAE